MRIIEALGALQFLKKELLTFTDIATALGVGRGAISNRHQRADKGYDVLKPAEIEKLENYFDVSLDNFTKIINAPQSPQDKAELAETVKKVLMETLIEYGGNDAVKKLLK